MGLEICVSINSNNTVLISFHPSEDKWEFPRNNRLKLFNLMNLILENRLVTPLIDSEMQNIKTEIQNIINDWISRGDLIIK